MPSTELSNRYILSPVYPRMFGYAVTLAMHITNGIHMLNTFKGDVLNDPDVKRFHDDQFKFLTVWNVYMQAFYAGLGLSCDVLSLTNEGKDSTLLKTLKRIRDPLFSSIVFPISLTVSSVFWSAFSYDRGFILPPSVDKTLGSTANHVIHTAVALVVLWELVFRPRIPPQSHLSNLVLMYSYATAYLIVLVASYFISGTWVYPILNLIDETIYLYLFFGIAILLAGVFYSLQWYLTKLVWVKIVRQDLLNPEIN